MNTLGQKIKEEFKLGAKLTDSDRSEVITIYQTFFPKKCGYKKIKKLEVSVRIEASTLTPE